MSLDAGRVGVRADQVDIHGRVTSPSFFNELLESLPEWTDMPVWVNGTEELLPSNNSVPVTSPILTDIAYPDIRRDNQYFTYRESPTPVDGLAKIKSIKGNTLVWNQLVRNNQRTSIVNGVTFTNNGDNSWNISGTATANIKSNLNISDFALDKQGIYFVSGCPSGGSESTYSFGIGGLKFDFGNGAIWKNSPNYPTGIPTFVITNGTTVNFTNVKFIICNLTQMFGTEKAEEILAMGQTDGIAYFRSLYPLPFYSYDSGSLLPFKGEGLKTVGFNQWDEEWEVGDIPNGVPRAITNAIRSKNFARCVPNTQYHLYCGSNTATTQYAVRVVFYDLGKNFISNSPWCANLDFITPSNCGYFKLTTQNTGNVLSTYGGTYNNDICINISSSKNGTYEPYASSTLSLPISTYFPTGMKSAGSVYDELTPTKAITRVGMIDLGAINWSRLANGLFIGTVNGMAQNASSADRNKGILSSLYMPSATLQLNESMANMTMLKNSGSIYIQNTSYADTASFKTAMSGVMLYYEMATPVELPTLSLGE